MDGAPAAGSCFGLDDNIIVASSWEPDVEHSKTSQMGLLQGEVRYEKYIGTARKARGASQ